MTTIVEIRALKVLDIDDFSDNVPFVRITCLSTGELLSSANARKAKGSQISYSFDKEEETNLLTFEVPSRNKFHEFSVSIFSKDTTTNQIICYHGVNKFCIQTEQSHEESDVPCSLLEDGDEMMECGQFIYAYRVITSNSSLHDGGASTVSLHSAKSTQEQQQEQEEEEAAAQAAMDDEMDKLMSQSNLHPDDERRLSMAADEVEQARAAAEALAEQLGEEIVEPYIPSPLNNSNYMTADGIDKQQKQKPRMNDFSVTAPIPANISPTSTGNPGKESLHHTVKPMSTSASGRLNVKSARDELIRRTSNVNSQSNLGLTSHNASTGVITPPVVVSAATHKATAATILSVLKEPNTNANQPIFDITKGDINNAADEHMYKKVLIRIHAVTVRRDNNNNVHGNAGDGGTFKMPTGSATLKVSLVPLPNKVTVFRSVTTTTTTANNNQTISDGTPNNNNNSCNSSATTYDFSLKTAALSLSLGDLRSKLYKMGAVPRLLFELQLNDIVYTAECAFYLPSLLRQHSGEMMHVELNNVSLTNSSGLCSSILFEVNPDTANSTLNRSSNNNDTVSVNRAMAGTSNTHKTSTTRASTRGGLDTTAHTIQPSGNNELPLYRMRNHYGQCTVTVNVLGITGSELKSHGDALSTSGSVITSACLGPAVVGGMSDVRQHDTRVIAPLSQAKSFNSSLFTLNTTYTFTSYHPSCDLVEIKVTTGNFLPDDECGRVYIPVASLEAAARAHPEYSATPFAYNAFRRTDIAPNASCVGGGGADGNTFTMCRWQVVCIATVSEYEPMDSTGDNIIIVTQESILGTQSTVFGNIATENASMFDTLQPSGGDEGSPETMIAQQQKAVLQQTEPQQRGKTNDWMSNTAPNSPGVNNIRTSNSRLNTSRVGATGTTKNTSTYNNQTASTLTAIKSVSGQLHCVFQGMFIRRPDSPSTDTTTGAVSATRNSNSSSRLQSLSRNEQVSLEATLLPEGVRKATASSAATQNVIAASDILSTVCWNSPNSGGDSVSEAAVSMMMTFDIAWALQQREVSCLRLNIVHPQSKTLLATAVLDLASIVISGSGSSTGGGGEPQQCLIPIRRTASSQSTVNTANSGYSRECVSLLCDSDVLGWIYVGMHFVSGSTTAGNKATTIDLLKVLENATKAQWVRLTQYAMQYYLGLRVNTANNLSALTPVAIQANKGNKSECMNLHFALSTLSINSKTNILIEQQQQEQQPELSFDETKGCDKLDAVVGDGYTELYLCMRLSNTLHETSSTTSAEHDDDNKQSTLQRGIVSTARLVNNTIVWSNTDVILKDIQYAETLNSTVYFYLCVAKPVTQTETQQSRQMDNTMLSTIHSTVNETTNSTKLNLTTLDNTATNYGNSNISKLTILAECNMILINNTLTKGMPMNYTVPFRNPTGGRLATLTFSVQSTATSTSTGLNTNNLTATAEDAYNQSSSPQFDFTATQNTLNQPAIHGEKESFQLKVDFLEGNITESSTWKSTASTMQPFFECTLLHTTNNNNRSVNMQENDAMNSNQARTGFLASNNNTASSSKLTTTQPSDNNASTMWDIGCILSVPSEEYLNSVPGAKNGILQGYNLYIVCRDGSKVHCPVIGTARIAIPTTLFNAAQNTNSRSSGPMVEQFITLTPPTGAAVIPSETLTGGAVRTAFSRIKVRLTPTVAQSTMDVDPIGMGSVVYRLLGISEASSNGTGGDVDGLVAASASCYMVNNSSELGGDGSVLGGSLSSHKELSNTGTLSRLTSKQVLSSQPQAQPHNQELSRGDALYSTSEATPSIYCPPHVMFNEQHILTGHITVPGGGSEIELSVRPFTSNTNLVATFPMLSTLTKLSDVPVAAEGGMQQQEQLGHPPQLIPPVPKFHLSLTKPTGSVSNTRVPRLSVEAVYVPYICGKLVIECTEVHIIDTQNITATLPTLRGPLMNSNNSNTQKDVTLRYVLGNQTSEFNYSTSIHTASSGFPGGFNRGDGALPNSASNVSVLGAGSVTGTTSRGSRMKQKVAKTKTSSGGGDRVSVSGVRNSPNGTPTKGKRDGFNPDNMAPSAGNKTTAVTVLDVDTHELLHNTHRNNSAINIHEFKGYVSLIPLFITVFEIDPLDNGTMSNNGSTESTQPVLGIGIVHTATLYYQAMRTAASSSMHSNNSNNSNSGRSGDTKPPPISSSAAASPWLFAVVDIFHPVTKQKAGTVKLNLQFIAESFPAGLIKSIQQSLSLTSGGDNSNNNNNSAARTELGLKQAFLVADEDRSGCVSVGELLKVIRNAESQRRTKRSSGFTVAPNMAATVGMENTAALLMSLVPQSANTADGTDSANGYSEDELVAMVSRIFARLDVDGDGLVSWWEWKAVLTATMFVNAHPELTSSSVDRVNPMDTLVIGITAANDALMCMKSTTNVTTASLRNALYPYLPIVDGNVIPSYDRLNIGNGPAYRLPYGTSAPVPTTTLFGQTNTFGTPADHTDNSAYYGGNDSKTVNKLHHMIKSLRVTNNILAKRFEKAILSAQKMNMVLDGEGLTGQASGYTGVITQQDVVRLEQRIQEAEYNNNTNLQAFLAAKNRGDLLASQLLELQSSKESVLLNETKALQNTQLNNNKLKTEIQAHTEKLNRVRSNRLINMKATVTVTMWLQKYILPYILKKRKERQVARLSHMLTSQIVKSRYQIKRAAELRVVTLIQRIVRGMLHRKRVRQLHNEAAKIQAVFRGKQDRDRVAELKRKMAVEAAAALFDAQYRATAVIKRCVQKWLLFYHNRRAVAARKIQEAAAKRRERKEMDARREKERRLLEQEKQAQDESMRKNQAAIAIQLAARERQRRKDGQALTSQQREFNKFRAERSAVVPAKTKPADLTTVAAQYWVDFSAADKSPVGSSTTTAAVISRKEDDKNAHLGRVENVDEMSRIMTVRYLVPLSHSSKPSSPVTVPGTVLPTAAATATATEEFVSKNIPFDHPQIKWFSGYVVPTHSHNRLVLNRATVPIIPNQAPYLAAAVGYRVEVPSLEEGAAPGDMFTGRVSSVNHDKNTILVHFETLSADSAEDSEEYPFECVDIQWIVRPKLERPDYIESCLGYIVEVNSTTDDDRIEGDYFVGSIVAVDEREQNVTIQYEQQIEQTQDGSPVDRGGADCETLSWLNHNITWAVPPAIPRPVSAAASLGYRVEIKSREPDAQIGDMFTGKIIGYNSVKNTVIVSFDTAADYQGPSDADTDELPFLSPDIHWTALPLFVPVISSKPQKIEDTIGYLVEIVSRETGAEDGDVFTGHITTYSRDRETVMVHFDSEAEQKSHSPRVHTCRKRRIIPKEQFGLDKKEFLFSSHDLHWLNNPKQSNAKYRPLIEETVGYTVEIANDSASLHSGTTATEFPLTGKILSFNAKTKNLLIRFETHVTGKKSEDVVTESIHYSSADLIWHNPVVFMDTRPGVERVKVKQTVLSHLHRQPPVVKITAPSTLVAVSEATIPAQSILHVVKADENRQPDVDKAPVIQQDMKQNSVSSLDSLQTAESSMDSPVKPHNMSPRRRPSMDETKTATRLSSEAIAAGIISSSEKSKQHNGSPTIAHGNANITPVMTTLVEGSGEATPAELVTPVASAAAAAAAGASGKGGVTLFSTPLTPQMTPERTRGKSSSSSPSSSPVLTPSRLQQQQQKYLDSQRISITDKARAVQQQQSSPSVTPSPVEPSLLNDNSQQDAAAPNSANSASANATAVDTATDVLTKITTETVANDKQVDQQPADAITTPIPSVAAKPILEQDASAAEPTAAVKRDVNEQVAEEDGVLAFSTAVTPEASPIAADVNARKSSQPAEQPQQPQPQQKPKDTDVVINVASPKSQSSVQFSGPPSAHTSKVASPQLSPTRTPNMTPKASTASIQVVHPDGSWSRPKLQEAVGHYITISGDPDGMPEDVIVCKVVGIKERDQSLLIQLYSVEDDLLDNEVDEIPYKTVGVKWYKGPPPLTGK